MLVFGKSVFRSLPILFRVAIPIDTLTANDFKWIPVFASGRRSNKLCVIRRSTLPATALCDGCRQEPIIGFLEYFRGETLAVKHDVAISWR